MADKLVRDVLIAYAPLTAIVSTRISPLIKAQGVVPPAITLRRGSTEPQNHLTGNGGLDKVSVIVDTWAETYVQARDIAEMARTALLAAGYQLENEFDNYEQGVDPGLYNVSQEFMVWK